MTNQSNEVLSGNTIVLLDPYTRKAATSITYDALAKHVQVITDIREVSDSAYAGDLVFFEPAVPAVVTPAVIKEYVAMYGVKPYLIYNTQEVADVFSGIATTVKADYHNIEWNLLYAVIHSDLAVLEPYQKIKSNQEKFSELLDSVPEDLKAPIDRMYTSYLDLGHTLSRVLTDNSILRETVDNYRSVGAKTTAAIEELKSLLQKATEDNRVYSAMLSESYDVTFNGLYVDRPRVLYIKSISHLSGIDSLLAVLYSVLTRQYKVSCKVVKLVDSANACSLRYIPNVYVPLTDTYSTYDVLMNDFVVAMGAYNVMLSSLMLNRSALDILIIHDMRGTMNDALDSSLVDLKLNEMSGDIATLALHDNVLSDLPKVSHFLWKFEDSAFKYTGTNTLKLANQPVIGKIIDYLI